MNRIPALLTFTGLLFLPLFNAHLQAQTTEEGIIYQVTGDSIVITGYQCQYSSGPKALVIPAQIDGLPVKSIGRGAFGGCSTITSVSIPGSVTEIDHGAFDGCSSLTSIELHEGLQSIGIRAFSSTALTEVLLPASLINIIGWPFSENVLEAINVAPESVYYASADGILFNKDFTALLLFPGTRGGHYVVPESVTRLGPYAFNDNQLLTSVVLPEGLTNFGAAFSGCSALQEVNIPDGVTSVGGFENCVSLSQIVLPDSVTSIEFGAFQACVRLSSRIA